MLRRHTPVSLLLFAILLNACASTGGGASPPAPTTPTPPNCDDALVINCAGIEALLVDERDQGLKRALSLVDERLAELPAELDFEAPPEGVLELATRVCFGPKELRLGLREQGFPVYAQLRLPGADEAAATAIEDLVADLIEDAGAHFSPPVETRDSLHRVSLIPAMGLFAWFGVPMSASDEFLLGISEASAEAADIGSPGLPQGIDPVFSVLVNGADLMRLGEMAESMQPPKADKGEHGMKLELYFGGELAEVTTTCAMGQGAQRAHLAATTWGARPALAEAGLLADTDLSGSMLRMLPASTVAACLGTAHLPGILDTILEAARGQMERQMPFKGDPLAMLHMMTGVDLRGDLFGQLGSSWGAWLAETGGGSCLLSGVAVVELENPETVAETFGRIRTMANGLLRMQTKGRVRLRRWTRPGPDGDLDLGTLTFPGLPVPFEVTCAVAHGCAWFGLTPQAVVGSVEFVASDGERLLDREDFRGAGGTRLGGLTGLAWLDTPALLSDGYGPATLAASALANATRSPRKRQRDAGMVLPTFSELRAGARPFLATSHWEGDNLVTNATADRSLVANLTALAGLMSRTPLPYLASGAIGAVLGSRSAKHRRGTVKIKAERGSKRPRALKIGLGLGREGAGAEISVED